MLTGVFRRRKSYCFEDANKVCLQSVVQTLDADVRQPVNQLSWLNAQPFPSLQIILFWHKTYAKLWESIPRVAWLDILEGFSSAFHQTVMEDL